MFLQRAFSRKMCRIRQSGIQSQDKWRAQRMVPKGWDLDHRLGISADFLGRHKRKNVGKVLVKKWQRSEAELARGKNNGMRGFGPEPSALEGGWEAVTLPDRKSEPWEVDNKQWALSLVAEPELAQPHAPSLRNQQPSLKTHPSPTTLTQQAREAPRNPLGEIQSPDLILRTSHHRKEEKIMKLSTFQLAIPLHRGGTGQGLAALQLFLPSDFRNCLPILVRGHHSKLSSVHSSHKKSKPQCPAVHSHTHPYPRDMGPKTRVKCQGPCWTAKGTAPSSYPRIRREVMHIVASSPWPTGGGHPSSQFVF